MIFNQLVTYSKLNPALIKEFINKHNLIYNYSLLEKFSNDILNFIIYNENLNDFIIDLQSIINYLKNNNYFIYKGINDIIINNIDYNQDIKNIISYLEKFKLNESEFHLLEIFLVRHLYYFSSNVNFDSYEFLFDLRSNDILILI